MKKTLSILLAITMLFAVCVPAFATDKTISSTDPLPRPEGHNQTTVTTLTKTDGGGEDSGATWTVTIPADQNIYWKQETVDLSYTVTAQLLVKQHLTVSVAGSAEKVLTNADTSETIAYTPTGKDFYDTVNPVVTDQKVAFGLSIDSANYAGIPVGAYSDTFTYTIAVKTNA